MRVQPNVTDSDMVMRAPTLNLNVSETVAYAPRRHVENVMASNCLIDVLDCNDRIEKYRGNSCDKVREQDALTHPEELSESDTREPDALSKP